MRDLEIPEKLPEQVKTIGAMIANNVRVKATCLKCELNQKVDLGTIRDIKGEGYILIDKFGACRSLDCDGRVFFSYFPIGGDDWIPLITRHFARTGSPSGSAHTLMKSLPMDEIIARDKALKAAVRERDGDRPASGGKRRRKFGR